MVNVLKFLFLVFKKIVSFQGWKIYKMLVKTSKRKDWWLILMSSGLKSPINNISVMLGLLSEKREKKNGIDTTPSKFASKEICCQQAKYDRAISLKAAERGHQSNTHNNPDRTVCSAQLLFCLLLRRYKQFRMLQTTFQYSSKSL